MGARPTEVIFGENGRGTLRVSEGGRASAATAVSGSILGLGDVTITGEFSALFITNELAVGTVGTGKLVIEIRGDITRAGKCILGKNADSVGTAKVSDPGSVFVLTELDVGGSGSGELEIRAGGTVISDTTIIGTESGSTGLATISDATSLLHNTGDFTVGQFGSGELTIESGGDVFNIYGYIGASSKGTATVTGAGSTWTNDQYLGVGYFGDGTLTIDSGGKISDLDGEIAVTGGTVGNVAGRSPTSLWTHSRDFTVGFAGRRHADDRRRRHHRRRRRHCQHSDFDQQRHRQRPRGILDEHRPARGRILRRRHAGDRKRRQRTSTDGFVALFEDEDPFSFRCRPRLKLDDVGAAIGRRGRCGGNERRKRNTEHRPGAASRSLKTRSCFPTTWSNSKAASLPRRPSTFGVAPAFSPASSNGPPVHCTSTSSTAT